MGVLHHVDVRVLAAVALVVGQREVLGVQDAREPGRATARRAVATAVGAGGREHRDRCPREEVGAVVVEVVELLVERPLDRRADVLAQLPRALDDVVDHQVTSSLAVTVA